MTLARTCDRVAAYAPPRVGHVVAVAIVLWTSLAVGCNSPASKTVEIAPVASGGGSSSTGREGLQRRSDAERLAMPVVFREVALPPGLATAEILEVPSVRPLDALVAVHLDERHAATDQLDESGASSSNDAVRNYVRGRSLLASGRPAEAIPFLESAIRLGGGTAGMRTLAEACDAAGRGSDALAIRRRLAVLGSASDEDLRRLLTELVRRRLMPEARAVSAARVRRSLDAGDARRSGDAAFRLSTVLDVAGEPTAAAEVRASLLRASSIDDAMLTGLSEARFADLHLLAGDDAAKAGDAVAADAFWRTAMEVDVIDPAVLRQRLLWSSAALGRDATVQCLLLEAAAAPSGGDLEMAIILADQGLEMPELCRRLAARLRDHPHDAGAARMLAMLDPVRMASVLNDGAAGETTPEARRSLVDAAVAGGPATTILVAAGVSDSIDLLDGVVDRLFEGPWTAGELLNASSSDEVINAGVDTAFVRAEIFRRHDRSDLAAVALEGASSNPDEPLHRVLAIRLAAAEMDPSSVLAVEAHPFDERVEAERVLGLLAAGEPEIAVEFAERAVRRSPMSPWLQAALGRSLSLARGRALEAVEATARAIRLGDRRWSTRIELAQFMQLVRADLPADSEVKLSLAMLGEDPVFRRLIEADQAAARGDAASAERILDGMLENPEVREEVLVRMLGIWRSLGQTAKGRRRIDSLLKRHPGDPALMDARFALRLSTGDREELINELRTTVRESVSALPSRRLESLLKDTDSDRSELARLLQIRMDRRSLTPARSIDELELAILVADPVGINEAIEKCEAIDVSTLTPRIRRRLASVAAAVPDRRGSEIVSRIANWSADDLEPVNADVAAAILRTLPATGSVLPTERLDPAPAFSWLDSDWRAVGLSLSETDVNAGAELLVFALDSPDAGSPANAGLIRSAIATGITAGWSAGRIHDLLERQAADGSSVADAFGSEGADRLALAEVSGDASLLGRRGLAIELLDIAAAKPGAAAATLNNLGFALLEGDESAVRRAAELLESAYQQDPASPSVLDSLGWLRYLEGRQDEEDPGGALVLISQSIERRLATGRPVSGEVLLHFADAAWRAGRQSDAVNAWSRITEQALATRELAGRLAAYADYQKQIWGRVLVPPKEMYESIDGRWIQEAELRLRAVAEDRSPPVTPTFRERGGVQDASE
ncbi:MAG: hypothetical protein CBB69_006695 [Phycisphaera sp. TMED9]|nr:MAG: hypothetical protein CBB69_006695 [Phycisphaera sp. TMED9]